MQAKGVALDPKCPRCGVGNETIEHVFKERSRTRLFYDRSPLSNKIAFDTFITTPIKVLNCRLHHVMWSQYYSCDHSQPDHTAIAVWHWLT